jgi:protease-4
MIPQPPHGQGPVDPRGAFMAPPNQPGMFPPPGGMPPMFPMMPPMFSPQPPRKSGGGKTVLLILVILLLSVSVLFNVLLLGGNAMSSGGATVRETVTEGAGDDKIAIVPIVGMIESSMSQQVASYLQQAMKDKNIKAIVVEIDSPGGTVTASDEIYAQLLRFKAEKKVPVVISMGSLATSGGYYAACAGDYLFAQQTTLTGNIGVLMPGFNFSKFMQKYGIEESTIIADGAPYKNAGSPFSATQPIHTEHFQHLADSMFTRFKDVVGTGRAAQLKQLGLKVDQVADGRAFTAAEAKANGLIDKIGYLSDAIAHATTAASLKNPTVFRYSRPPGLLDLFGVASSLSSPRGTTVNGVNVNVDHRLLEELATPRMLYLWRGN